MRPWPEGSMCWQMCWWRCACMLRTSQSGSRSEPCTIGLPWPSAPVSVCSSGP